MKLSPSKKIVMENPEGDASALAVSTYGPESVQPDRTCHMTHDFEDIVQASLKDAVDLRCEYCTDFVSIDLDHFKNHLLRVHYTFSYNYMLDDQCVCVLPCRRGCISKPQQGNRSHFHCPTCARLYSRKPALSHHIEVYKGRCVAVALSKGRPLGRRVMMQNRAIPRLKSVDDPSESPGMAENHHRNVAQGASYTVVVDEDLNTGEHSVAHLQMNSEPRHKVPKLNSSISETPTKTEPEEDAAAYFGKTVTSRIRGFNKKKQAEAMQKIMQILFDIEYADGNHAETE